MDYSKIYKVVSESVVNVVQLDSDTNFHSMASGVIIDDGSKVLTCSHCVEENFKNGILVDKSKNLVKIGNVIFKDEKRDIAIIDFGRVIGVSARITTSSALEIGNEIFTIGFPYSLNSAKTLTTGNIAAFENGLIKIDASVNNGNSGGPLFNTNGDVVGIVNLKLGGLSDYLEGVEQAQTNIRIRMGGIDAIETIQQMLREMKRNINLGIGYAVPTDLIANISPLIKSIIK